MDTDGSDPESIRICGEEHVEDEAGIRGIIAACMMQPHAGNVESPALGFCGLRSD